MKRAFIAPVRLLLLLGALTIFDPDRNRHLGAMELLVHRRPSSCHWALPLSIFIEAIVYWRISNRNKDRSSSWAHLLFLAVACATIYLRDWIYYSFVNGGPPSEEFSRLVWISNLVEPFVFWILMVLAHLFFVKVLLNARATRVDISDPLDLLDDAADEPVVDRQHNELGI